MRYPFLIALGLVACSSEDAGTAVDAATDTATTDTATTDTATGDTGSDTGPKDTATDSAEAAVDGATDAPDAVADALPEAGDAAGKLEVSTTATIFGNCMPIAPADAAGISGTVTVKNLTAATIGPMTIEYGVLEAPGGAAYATFKVDKVDLGTIAPGATKTSAWKKTTDTWSSDPSDHICKKCGKDAVVRLTMFGLGTTTIASPSVSVSCAF